MFHVELFLYNHILRIYNKYSTFELGVLMGKIISIFNQKGGVGKTTTAVNLTAALGLAGKRVLLVDVDPQGNSTSGLGINKQKTLITSYEVLIGNARVSDAVHKTEYKNVDIMPSKSDLAGAEIELTEVENRESRMKSALLQLREQYDYIFIDCPPSLGLIAVNALNASDTVLVPIQCEFFAMEGLSQLMATVRQVKRSYNPMLELEGILLTMFDGRLNLTQQVVGEIKKYFAKKLYSTVIPRTVRLSEAPSFGMPIQYYDKRSKGADAYTKLAKEFLKRNRG